MLASLGLSSPQLELAITIASQLSEIPGIESVVLGGSYARGTARPDSDLDLGLYYSDAAHPDVEAIRATTEKFSLPNRPPTVTGFYEWGPWVNGGAWIHTAAGKVDLLYRNLEQLQRVIDESQAGIYHHHFYQQPTFGFVSVIYLAETKSCLPLFDRQNLLAGFKRRVEIYPLPLQEKLVRESLWTAEFAFLHADGFALRGDIFNTVGCLGRIAFMLVQALFALNSEYYFGDKGSVEATDRFSRRPEQFSTRLQGVLALQMATPGELKSATHQMHNLWKEVVALTEGRYMAKYYIDRGVGA
jgi:Nucleotidyltransferase domain